MGITYKTELHCHTAEASTCAHETAAATVEKYIRHGYTTLVLIYMAVGIAAFYDDNIIRLFDNYWCLILGGLTSVLSIFPRLILQKKKAIEGETKSVKSLAEKKDFGLVQTIALNLLSCSGAMQVVVLLAILTHTLNLFILLYFVLNFGMTALSLKRMLND